MSQSHFPPEVSQGQNDSEPCVTQGAQSSAAPSSSCCNRGQAGQPEEKCNVTDRGCFLGTLLPKTTANTPIMLDVDKSFIKITQC